MTAVLSTTTSRLEAKAPALSPAEDLRRRVAVALSVRADEVKLKAHSIRRDARSVRCCGTANRQEFFAKILLADPYPLTVVVPWKEALRSTAEWRAADDQVETEWSTSQQLYLLLAENLVPRPLGRSREAKTIVWEEIKARSVLDLVKKSRWLDPKGYACAAALLKAGMWLRQVHDKTADGTETVSLSAMADAICQMMAQQETSTFITRAETILKSGLQEIAASTLTVPVALNHGDFTLANLMWDRGAGKLSVVDFENPTRAGTWQDLATIVFSLRKQLLNPLVPRKVVRAMEHAFWTGYGAVPRDLLIFVQTLVASRILFYYPNRLTTRGDRHGWLAGVGGSLYRSLFLPGMLSRCVKDSPARVSLCV